MLKNYVSPNPARDSDRQHSCGDESRKRDKILEYAFNEERILVTANIGDFEKFALAFEIHAGIVFIQEGDLLRNEQIEICTEAVKFIQQELEASRDMINRVLYISINGTKQLETFP